MKEIFDEIGKKYSRIDMLINCAGFGMSGITELIKTDDIKRLMSVINRIADQKATVIIIEHNLDVIKLADYIIDMGPEGGDKGGNVVFTGTPREMVQTSNSYTARYLKPLFEKK